MEEINEEVKMETKNQNWNKCPNCKTELERGNLSENGGSGMPESAYCPKCNWNVDEAAEEWAREQVRKNK